MSPQPATGPLHPIRLAFVVHAMRVAGAEVLVAETIQQLAARIQPVVFCLEEVGSLGHKLRSLGVEVVAFDRHPGRDFGVATRMASETRARNIELLHAHQYTPFFYAALARVLSRKNPKLIFTEHGRHYPDRVSLARRTVNHLVLRRLADDVNAVSEFSARALSEHDGFSARTIHVIENGVKIERYRTGTDKADTKRRLGLDPARRYVANIARFHPVKDHATLLRAFHRIVTRHIDVDLLLVGDGELRRALEELAERLGIASRVHFTGVRDDVPDILRAIDIFALTSLSEAASLTLIEAMASGVPVVVTAVGGNPELVRHDIDGLLVPRADDHAIAEAILELLDNPNKARAMGEAGAARARERYRLETTIERYYALYSRLTGRTR